MCQESLSPIAIRTIQTKTSSTTTSALCTNMYFPFSTAHDSSLLARAILFRSGDLRDRRHEPSTHARATVGNSGKWSDHSNACWLLKIRSWKRSFENCQAWCQVKNSTWEWPNCSIVISSEGGVKNAKFVSRSKNKVLRKRLF